MRAESACDFLHRVNAAAHGLVAPEIQEHASPSGRIVLPELLEVFLEQIGADGLQVVAKQIAQAELLLRGEIVLAFEHTPAGLFQAAARGPLEPSGAIRRRGPRPRPCSSWRRCG